MSRAGRGGRWLLGALPLLFLAVFFAWPLVAVLDRGLRPDGALDLAGALEVLRRPSTAEVVRFTLWEATLSTALTLAVGLPLAQVLSRHRFRGRGLLQAVLVVPFVLPTVVVAAAWTALLGADGPLPSLARAAGIELDLRHSVAAVVLAHAFFNVAVVVRTVGLVWERLDPSLVDAARTLGASRWRAAAIVEAPLLAPAILASAVITFLFSATSFAVVLILGGPMRATVEVEIWRSATQLLDLQAAAVLSVVQLLAVVALLVVTTAVERRAARSLPQLPVAQRLEAVRGAARWWVGGVLVATALVLGAPLAVLVERSLWLGDGVGYGFGAWQALGGELRDSVLFVPPLEAVATSLRTAAASVVLAVPLGVAAAVALGRRRSPWQEIGLLLPLGASAVTMGFGMLLAFGGPPLAIRGEPWLVPVAHAVVALPFVVRVVLPVVRSVDPAMREAAAVLGATPTRVWLAVDAPVVGRAAAVAAGFAAAISLGEFGATTFLARASHPTVPLLIERLLGQPGAANRSQAMALSVLLAVLVASVVLVVDRWRSSEGGW